ncbi:hypothetical protein EBT16_00050 [bacterium]|nr:hypothetical protein [bacterium]
MPADSIIRLRKGTSQQWSIVNPILSSGEPGYDTTNGIIKVGDGTTRWNQLSGHKHLVAEIEDFNSKVAQLLPVTNIVGGANISVVANGTEFSIGVSGQLGLTTEQVDDRVSSLLVAGSGINLNYDDDSNAITISVSGLSSTLKIGNGSADVISYSTNETLNVVGSGKTSVNYNDATNTITIGSPQTAIEEYNTTSNFPATGDSSILYIATDTGQIYKWDGAFYYEAGPRGASTGFHGTQHKTDGTDPIPLAEYIVPQLTSNVNNLAHDNKDVLYLSSDANNRELTGLLAPTFSCIKLLVNISPTNTIVIDNQSTNSDPANRFLSYTGSDYYLLPGQSLSVLYSTDTMRWRIL